MEPGPTPLSIGETHLLSFLARETLEDVKGVTHLREVKLKETTMKRTIVVFVRTGAYLSPPAQILLSALKGEGAPFFVAG